MEPQQCWHLLRIVWNRSNFLAHANGRDIVGQQLPTMLGVLGTCCVRLHEPLFTQHFHIPHLNNHFICLIALRDQTLLVTLSLATFNVSLPSFVSLDFVIETFRFNNKFDYECEFFERPNPLKVFAKIFVGLNLVPVLLCTSIFAKDLAVNITSLKAKKSCSC